MENLLIIGFIAIVVMNLLIMAVEGLVRLVKKETTPEWLDDLLRIGMGVMLVLGIILVAIQAFTERAI